MEIAPVMMAVSWPLATAGSATGGRLGAAPEAGLLPLLLEDNAPRPGRLQPDHGCGCDAAAGEGRRHPPNGASSGDEHRHGEHVVGVRV